MQTLNQPVTTSPTTVQDTLYHPTLLAKAEATILNLISELGQVTDEQIRGRLMKASALVTPDNLGIVQTIALASLIEKGQIYPLPLASSLYHQGFTWALADGGE